jgi:hypothetical protein
MTAIQPVQLPAELTVVAYPDAVVEAHGFGPDHPYIEAAVVPVVGPSATLMWKRLGRLVIESAPRPVTLDTADLLACLGLSTGLARNGTGARTVARMVCFDLARRAGRDGTILAVRQALAAHNEIRARRLPGTARRYHDQITRRPAAVAVRFPLGKLHVTPGAVTAMANAGVDPAALLTRHQSGDWGEVELDEALSNNEALNTGARLRSIYDLSPTGWAAVWLITEGDRRATTITLPGGC